MMKAHLVSQLYDIQGKKVKDIALANKAEVYYYTPKEVDPYRVDFFEKLPLHDRFKLRNTYTVPKGQQVVVQTPEGEKKYTGGQFVPPEQMGKAQILDNSSGESSGRNSGENPEQQENTSSTWKNVFNSLKNVQSEDVNKASYVLRQFIPEMPLSYSRSISPEFKFATELTIANILNSFPGVGKELVSNGLSINLNTPTKDPSLLGQGFVCVAQVDLKKNQVELFEIKKKDDNIVHKAAGNISYILGILFAETIHNLLSSYDEEQVTSELQSLQQTLDRLVNEYAAKNKGKTPVQGANEDIDKITETINNLTTTQELVTNVKTILKDLKNAMDKENPFNAETLTKTIGKVIQYANVNSFAPNMDLEGSFESVASMYPETTYNIKKLIDNVS